MADAPQADPSSSLIEHHGPPCRRLGPPVGKGRLCRRPPPGRLRLRPGAARAPPQLIKPTKKPPPPGGSPPICRPPPPNPPPPSLLEPEPLPRALAPKTAARCCPLNCPPLPPPPPPPPAQYRTGDHVARSCTGRDRARADRGRFCVVAGCRPTSSAATSRRTGAAALCRARYHCSWGARLSRAARTDLIGAGGPAHSQAALIEPRPPPANGWPPSLDSLALQCTFDRPRPGPTLHRRDDRCARGWAFPFTSPWRGAALPPDSGETGITYLDESGPSSAPRCKGFAKGDLADRFSRRCLHRPHVFFLPPRGPNTNCRALGPTSPSMKLPYLRFGTPPLSSRARVYSRTAHRCTSPFFFRLARDLGARCPIPRAHPVIDFALHPPPPPPPPRGWPPPPPPPPPPLLLPSLFLSSSSPPWIGRAALVAAVAVSDSGTVAHRLLVDVELFGRILQPAAASPRLGSTGPAPLPFGPSSAPIYFFQIAGNLTTLAIPFASAPRRLSLCARHSAPRLRFAGRPGAPAPP